MVGKEKAGKHLIVKSKKRNIGEIDEWKEPKENVERLHVEEKDIEWVNDNQFEYLDRWAINFIQ